jgi:hypothetical protein
MTTAISTSSFIDSLGVNTHIDFDADGYQNLATVEAAIEYLGLKNIRDSAQQASDASAWLQVSQATGAKFDDYIGETSPAGMSTDLSYVAALAAEGVLNDLEGGNEEDDAYPASLGNTLAITAQFQQQVYATAHEYGLDAINMSFGAGWTAANDWHGDYDKVGNLSAYADYANAHTYPQTGQTTDSSIQQLNSDALLAAGSRQVITTEIGWNATTFSQSAIAQYVVQAALDGIKDGDAKMYYYALFNDSSGNYGLMNSNGSATPAGTALHDLTTLLADTGSNASSFTPGSLNYALSGENATDNSLLMQKSDGSDWIAVWDESAGTHTVTVKLPVTATTIKVYDPVTGTSTLESASNASSISLSLGNDPLLVEVIPSGSTASTGSSGSSTSGTTSTSTSSGLTSSGATTSSSSTSGSTSTSGSSPDPVLAVPASESVAAGASVAISGVSLSDPWAASHAGTLALNVTTSGGTVSMKGASGTALAGSGTSAIHVSGSLAQINADLATLSYTAGSANASVAVNVWDQSGAEATKSVGVTIGSGTTTSGGATTSGSTTSGSTTTSTITIASTDADPVENVSNAAITATGGDHLIFIGGTGNVLTATGGTESVQAFQGGNTITTGAGNDKIYFSGSNNVVNAGAGNNTLYDSGTNNTIVLPGANQGYDDIYGYMMTNGDKFDLRGLLASTSWNGDVATIGKYVSVTPSGTGSVIKVDPSGVTGGATSTAATLEAAGPVSLTTLLAHSIT